MYEATFHIEGNVAYEGATAGRDVSIELWCNDHCDLLHVRGDAEGEVRDEVERAVGVKDTIERANEQIIITAECLQPYVEDNIEGYLSKHECLFLPPLRYESGGKVVRVLTLESRNLTEFYQDAQESFEVTVRSKREVNTVTQDHPMLSDRVLPSLSDRQEEAVVLAWESGYYEIPRGTTTAELAEHMGIDRRTLEEHLRLAEYKLVGTLVEQFLV